ncbi:MAG: sigma-70 family RNA polymerase sigma factor [Bryobacteraceae bacterium]
MRGYPVATAILDLIERRAAEASASDDLCLAESLRQGDERAYEVLITRFQQPVYTLASRLLNDPAEAADVVQEVFLKVFRSIGHFRGQSSLKTWMYRITVNEAHNARRWFFRHRRCETELDGAAEEKHHHWLETVADHSRSPFDEACNQEQRRIIEAALLRLNPLFKEAVVLRDIADLSYEEIAEVLDVSLGTVKSRILRGREALRAELADSLGERPVLRLVPKTAE